MIGLRLALHRFVAAQEGLAAVELAIIAPVLVVCALCVGDLGRWALYRTWVTYAANAGAEYAAAHVTSLPLAASDGAKIASAAKAAVPNSLVTINPPTASGSYGCATASGVTTSAVTQTTVCPSGTSTGGVAGRYVTVTVTAPFGALFSAAGIAYPSTVSAATMVRIQ